MSFFDWLLLIGAPLVIYFGLLMWSSSRSPRHGWKPRDSSTTAQPLETSNTQQELAALARISSKFRHPSPAAQSAARPSAFNVTERWGIRYVDAYGEVTERVIQIHHLNLRFMAMEAFCETRQALRTFKVRNIKHAWDPRTGVGINVSDYVAQVRTERRASRSAV